MPTIDMPISCIPAECDNIKLPFGGEIASRWDACLLCDFAGISLRLCSISLRSFRITFAAYLPKHIKFLTEFHRIFFGTTCISFPYFICPQFWQVIFKIICQNQGKYQVLARYSKNYLPKSRKIWSFGKLFTKLFAKTQEKRYLCVYLKM